MIRILLADDQKSIREMLRLRLESEPDFEVVGTASDGDTALEMAEILRPDIVLIDMEMPGLDGVKATELICQTLPNVKVLVLSAHNDDKYIIRALRSGAMGYLLKSTPAQELREAIRFVHRGYSQFGPGVLNKTVFAESSGLQPLGEARTFETTLSAQVSIEKLAETEPISIDRPVSAVNRLPDYQPLEDFTGWGVTLWRIVRTRWLPSVAVASAILGAVIVNTFFFEERLYRSETWIQVSSKSSVPISSLPKEEIDLDTNEDVSKGRSTEVQILKSSPMIAKAIAQLPAAYNDQLSIQDIEGNLSISQAEEDGLLSNVLIVEYSDTDPKRVYTVLKVLGNTYIKYSTETTRLRATSAIKFIEQKLPATRQKLNQANAEVKEFRKRYGMVTPESFAQDLEKTKLSISNDIRQANVVLNQAQSRVAALQRRLQELGQDSTQSTFSAVLGQDKNYQELSTQLKDIEVKLSLQRAGLSEDHPIIRDLQEQRTRILALRQNVAQRLVGDAASTLKTDQPSSTADSDVKDANTNNILNSLSGNLLTAQTELDVQKTQLSSLRQSQALVNSRFQQLPQLQETYANIQREVTLNSSELDNLLKKLQELKIAAAQETNPWNILQPPTLPTKPIAPNISRNLLFGLLFSGVAGLGTALLLERLDSRVKSLKEAVDLTGLPLVGSIPFMRLEPQDANDKSGFSNNYSNNYNCASFEKAIRSLAVHLQYLTSNCGIQTLIFTSSEAGEGKSTITYELGLTLARLGLNVLLVDADIHNPTLHIHSLLSNRKGLSNILSEEEVWSDCIQPGEVSKLHILTAGTQPDDSLSLFPPEKISELLYLWRQTYDYVLIDTPSLNDFIDVQGLASKVDLTVLIVGLGRAEKSAVLRAMNILKLDPSRLLGLVVNMVNTKEKKYGPRLLLTSADLPSPTVSKR